MARKSTFLNTIYLDWDQRDPDGGFDGKVRNQADWEDGVMRSLSELYCSQNCETSRAVLNNLALTGTSKGKSVTIVPFTLKSWQTATQELRAKVNAGAIADDKPAATVRGERSDELPQSVLDEIAAAPVGPERDAVEAKYGGTGAGSSSHLYFTAQFFATPRRGVGLDAADEALLHELIHSLRQEEGQEDPTHLTAPFAVLRGGEKDENGNPTPTRPLSQIYETVEEFAAIVITNIYRSEKEREGLRSHHLADVNGDDPPLMYPLTNARNFLTVWRRQLIRLATDLPFLCNKVAAINCSFNPLFELYAALDRFPPGSRTPINKSWAGVR